MVAGDTGTAMVLAMAFPETGAMPFRSTDADHTDIRADTTTDMALDTEIPATQGGTQTIPLIRRILRTTITHIQHGHTRHSALEYSSRMAGEFSLQLRKLAPGRPCFTNSDEPPKRTRV